MRIALARFLAGGIRPWRSRRRVYQPLASPGPQQEAPANRYRAGLFRVEDGGHRSPGFLNTILKSAALPRAYSFLANDASIYKNKDLGP